MSLLSSNSLDDFENISLMRLTFSLSISMFCIVDVIGVNFSSSFINVWFSLSFISFLFSTIKFCIVSCSSSKLKFAKNPATDSIIVSLTSFISFWIVLEDVEEEYSTSCDNFVKFVFISSRKATSCSFLLSSLILSSKFDILSFILFIAVNISLTL